MKGVLNLNEDNQYILFDKERTESNNLSKLINTYRNDKLSIQFCEGNFKLDGYAYSLNGYIASKKVGKGLYDVIITEIETSFKTGTEGYKNDIEGFNLTDWLFKHVGEMISIDINVARNTESEVTK